MSDLRKARVSGPFVFSTGGSSPTPAWTEAPSRAETESDAEYRARAPVIAGGPINRARAPIYRAGTPVISWCPIRPAWAPVCAWSPIRPARAPIGTARAPVRATGSPVSATWAPISTTWTPMAITPMPPRREFGGLGDAGARIQAGRAGSGFRLDRHRQHHRARCCQCQEKLFHLELPQVERNDGNPSTHECLSGFGRTTRLVHKRLRPAFRRALMFRNEG